MKRRLSTKLLSFLLVLVLGLTTPVAVSAQAAEDSKGKYISDVFIAYGKSADEAKSWLKNNGWEPVGKDLNDGNTSKAPGFKNAAAVMGIKRTNDPNKAITDMATMNMKGGYSFDDYESLVNEKKADIKEFIRTFTPVLEEYRANYNNKGSQAGKKRAQYAHDLLNKFYDGNDDEYALNDTGLSLGDLFLNKVTTEYNDSDYAKLSADEKKKTGDFQQIILESSGPAVITVEQALALASDTAETTWLERLPDYAGEDGLFDHLTELVPEAKGQRITESIAMNYLHSKLGDTADVLAEQWYDINEEIIWFENYCDDNELWQEDGESDEDYSARLETFFNGMSEDDDALLDEDYTRYTSDAAFYFILSEIEYEGDWGETLYDFFRDEEEEEYGNDSDNFLPLAAALSKGQRAGISLISLPTLLQIGYAGEEVTDAQFPSIKELFKGQDENSISIYSGINRAIFRQGVALTSEALMKKNSGEDPYEQIWKEGGIVDIVAYTSLGVGAVSLITGVIMAVKAAKIMTPLAEKSAELLSNVNHWSNRVASWTAQYNKAFAANVMQPGKFLMDPIESGLANAQMQEGIASRAYNSIQSEIAPIATMGKAARWMMGIGGALMIAAAVLKAVQLAKFYNRDFTQIPRMIVNEDNIVSYSVDKNGNVVKDINFNQYVYYEAVKCNRQQIGIHKNAQDGVEDYEKWGCGDIADLCCDVGLQWLALYVNKSRDMGDPILADSIVVQYGSKNAPESNMGTLHMFTYKNSVDIGSDAYNYRNDNNGIYMFWKTDANAYTASTFNYGYLALAAIGGLAVGIVGTTGVILPKRKKENSETPITA